MHLAPLQTLLITTIMALTMTTVMADDDDEKTETVINELAWGEALYEHFRGEPLQAITRLTARLEQGGIQVHKDQADLLLAGIYLDYGMPNLAAEKLASINIESLSPRLSSKMYLANARIFYQQQDYSAAELALSKVQTEQLNDRDVNLASFISAQIFFSTERYAEAAEVLTNVSDASNLQLYANYNHGLSLLRLTDEQSQTKAISLLKQVAQQAVYDQEQYALADQAKLALAMHALDQSDFTTVTNQLSDIRLDGLVSKDALLLLGWNYAKQEDFDTALVYWQALADDTDVLSPVVQEAWLAVPYAWQKQGNRAKALQGYQFALEIQADTQQKLADLKNKLLWQEFIAPSSANDLQDYPAFYRELTADPAFHELLTQWQELEQLKTHLELQSRRIPVLELSVKENESRYLAKTEFIKTQLANISLTDFQTQVDGFKAQLEQQQQQEVPIAILPKDVASIWQRVIRSESNVDALQDANHGDQADLQEKSDKLNILKGVAKWQIHRQRPSYEWQAIKAQRDLQIAHADLVTQHELLNQQIVAMRPVLQMDDQQLQQMVAKNNQMLSEINILQEQISASMAAIYEQIISRRILALDNLAEQANLAIARLTYELATEEYRRD